MMALASAPWMVSINFQFFFPTQNGRIARSAGTTLRMPGFTSSPVSSHRNCSSLISSKSSVFRGHLNFPSSSLLYSNRNPSPSQTKALIRSFRLPQKRNSMSVSKGFRLNRSRTVAASPSIPYLKSVYPQAM